MANRLDVLTIDGMVCINCQNRIEQTLNETEGILEAHVSFSNGNAEVLYQTQIISYEIVKGIIEELGYSVSIQKRDIKSLILRAVLILVCIVFLYVLLQQSGLLNILVPARLADSKMGYGMLFVVGLLTSVHCVAMC